ncbi:MAG: hypothetical protein Sapg2KO_01770 [Saprospiraceae bacterium]
MNLNLKDSARIKQSSKVWIEAGYRCFAASGPSSPKVEVLARLVNKSKSSFYHHFADLEIFIDQLLNHHFQQAQVIAVREQNCQNLIPELVNILVDVKTDLLFSRQLRVHRANPQYEACFQKTSQLVMGPFMEVWASDIGLADKPFLADQFFDLASENFYLQITEEKLNYEWLVTYFKDLKRMVQDFQR